MVISLSRRRLLRGASSVAGCSMRPPWALPESEFVSACSRCGDCLPACPTRILVRGSGGYPTLDFMLGQCTFCGACGEACKDDALHSRTDADPWAARAAVAESCLASQRVVCRICGDACEVTAISFLSEPGGKALPRIDVSACTGCGACVAGCPARAIRVTCSEAALAA